MASAEGFRTLVRETAGESQDFDEKADIDKLELPGGLAPLPPQRQAAERPFLRRARQEAAAGGRGGVVRDSIADVPAAGRGRAAAPGGEAEARGGAPEEAHLHEGLPRDAGRRDCRTGGGRARDGAARLLRGMRFWEPSREVQRI